VPARDQEENSRAFFREISRPVIAVGKTIVGEVENTARFCGELAWIRAVRSCRRK
jgi:hypothetical protein